MPSATMVEVWPLEAFRPFAAATSPRRWLCQALAELRRSRNHGGWLHLRLAFDSIIGCRLRDERLTILRCAAAGQQADNFILSVICSSIW